MNRSGGGALALALLVAVWASSGGMRSSDPAPHLAAKPAPQQTTAAAQPNTKKQVRGTHSEEAHPNGDGFHDQGELCRP